jgi:tetratricopeptide (TPR) repeat protein
LYKTGRNAEAINAFGKALEIFDKIKFAFGVATSYNNLGYVYGQMGRVEEGLDHLHAGLDYVEEKTFREAQLCKGYLAKSQGELYIIKGAFSTAEKSFNEALDIFRQGYKAEEAEVLMLKGKLYKLTGKIKKSNELLSEAISLATKVGCPEVVQKCSHLLSD